MNINTAQVAGLVRIEQDLAAWVGCYYRPQMLQKRIVLVHLVKKNYARFGRLPGLKNDEIKKRPGVYETLCFSGSRIYKRIILVFLVVVPKITHKKDGDVEVAKGIIAVFYGYKTLNIRMIGV